MALIRVNGGAESDFNAREYIAWSCDNNSPTPVINSFTSGTAFSTPNGYAPSLMICTKGINGTIEASTSATTYWTVFGVKNGVATALYQPASPTTAVPAQTVDDYDYIFIGSGQNDRRIISVTVTES